MSNVIFWFRNDLRLHDNEALLRAMELGDVTPVYVIDDRDFEETTIGLKRMGNIRANFLLESLHDLQKNLRGIGSELIIRRGNSPKEVATLARQLNATHVVTSKQATQDETTTESELSLLLKQANIDIELVWQNTLFHPRNLPFQMHFLPDVFTEFRKKVESRSEVRKPLPTVVKLPSVQKDIENQSIPTLQDLGYEPVKIDERAVLQYTGGETAGLQRLNDYFWKNGSIDTYKETRNGLIGSEYSTKFSAWLSLGCLSPRTIYHDVKKYEAERVANESTYWVIFELIWRDFYYFIALKYGVRLFKRSGIKHDMTKSWNQDLPAFKKWVNGKTGVPFIDANMREINATGFMSNRGRQNVASFLTKDLGVEWWWGGIYFQHILIDYDICSNWGNWNYVSGIGNDPREDRYFNILKQASTYDPDGNYVKRWLPELKNVPADKIHQVGLLTDEEQHKYGVRLGEDYPKPIVDIKKWQKFVR